MMNNTVRRITLLSRPSLTRVSVRCYSGKQPMAPAQGVNVAPPKPSTAGSTNSLPIRLQSGTGALATELYKSAMKSGDVDKIGKELDSVLKNFENSELTSYMIDPTLTFEKKRKILDAVFRVTNPSPSTHDFLLTVLKEGNFHYVPTITNDYKAMLEARFKATDVSITVADEKQATPSDEIIRRLLELDSDAKINVQKIVDPEIVGGAILSTSEKMLDLSYASSLTELEADLDQTFAQYIQNDEAALRQHLNL
eukprot:TRINITY_DN236_c0_g1_i1.p1 TRINITY_DN236_c0_g1~~TRINITY_DN236_c0_g1_i1.p1  ORF type:complete len:253 (-),score=93.59 TRINITY_DN236_c0_g1_i1:82-840(-)